MYQEFVKKGNCVEDGIHIVLMVSLIFSPQEEVISFELKENITDNLLNIITKNLAMSFGS